MLKVLLVTSEAQPLAKTGGLADVCGALPRALRMLDVDARLLLPGYPQALQTAENLRTVARLSLPPLSQPVTLHEGRLPASDTPVYLIDYPPAFSRAGHLYLDDDGEPWFDNAARFALLSRAAVELALDRARLAWRPDLVHCHDWQTGLVPALLALERSRPRTLFTVHNLSYQGLFPYDTFSTLHLPPSWWSPAALEFHGQCSFIKGGLVFADALTTVSPAYAREIQTPQYGCGLDGLLRHRADALHGILNGIDVKAWDPARDAYLYSQYGSEDLAGKGANKTALLNHFGLDGGQAPLLGFIGRLVEQKGVDLILDSLSALADRGVRMVMLGSGDRRLEAWLAVAANRHAAWLAARIGYDERLAHLIEAGADMFLMPSRFEPCGLNQMYSLRYGTLPIVRRVGGLADTVVDADEKNLSAGTANGFVFDEPSSAALTACIERALALYREPVTWKKLARHAMSLDFSSKASAERYLALYRELRDSSRRPLRAAAT